MPKKCPLGKKNIFCSSRIRVGRALSEGFFFIDIYKEHSNWLAVGGHAHSLAQQESLSLFINFLLLLSQSNIYRYLIKIYFSFSLIRFFFFPPYALFLTSEVLLFLNFLVFKNYPFSRLLLLNFHVLARSHIQFCFAYNNCSSNCVVVIVVVMIIDFFSGFFGIFFSSSNSCSSNSSSR